MVRKRMVLGLVAAAAAVMVLAAPAGAVLVKLPGGKTISYFPTHVKARALAAQLRSDQAFSNLDYNGGPVMPSNTDYLIFWSPSGAGAYPANYESGLQQYWTDLAHDSGGHQNTDSAAAQYNDSSGNFARYDVTYGGSFDDSDPYPTNHCGAAGFPAGNPCLTDAQIQAELQTFLAANSLPEDLSHEYFVVLPPNVDTCFDTNPSDGCDAHAAPAYAAYCAYHGNTPYTPGSPVIIYANDLYVNDTNCQTGNWSNGPADGLLDGGMSHEHNESVTDPIPNTAWTDFATGSSTGYENGDKCAYNWGTPLGGAGTAGDPYYNQVINGHHYFYQQEWSNQSDSCVQRFTFSGREPTAQFTVTPGSGTTMSFDASGSTAPGGITEYHWEFEDPGTGSIAFQDTFVPTVTYHYTSAGLHTVSLTVYAADGTSIGTSRIVKTGQGGPNPAFSQTSATAVPGQTVSFDASGSSDSGGTITGYSWNFGDGSAPASGATQSHAYTSSGIYTVTLTITDSSGQSSAITHTVTVDIPPSASFTASSASVVPGQAISFNGTGSTDADGTIAAYSWSFGDGTTAAGPTTAHSYRSPGVYQVRLTVTDDLGESTTSAARTITVDELPSSRILVLSSHPATGLPVQFSGTKSSDPDGAISAYSWSFGDGATASGPMPSHLYAAPGTYAVRLTVTDSAGHQGTSVLAVTVARAATISGLRVKSRTVLVKVTGAGIVSYRRRSVSLAGAGTARFRVVLTSAQRRRLRRGHRVRIRVAITFVPMAGPVMRETVGRTVLP